MSSRPNNPRITGCFVLFFFLIWTAITFGILSIFLFGNPTIEGDPMVFYIIIGIFLLIDVVGIIYIIRLFTGKISRRPSGSSGEDALSALPSMTPGEPDTNGYCRLKPEASHRTQFFLLLIFAIVWNGMVGLITWINSSGDQADKAPWWLLSIFIAVGVLLLFGAVYFFFRWIMVGETTVHVSADPVVPGQPLEIRVSQPGRFVIERMVVDFVLQEKATYRSGKHTHTKKEIVREEAICDITNAKARGEKVLTHQSFRVPADAPPSFDAPRNKITWLVRVKLTLPGRPDVEQCFPVRVASPEILRTEARDHG